VVPFGVTFSEFSIGTKIAVGDWWMVMVGRPRALYRWLIEFQVFGFTPYLNPRGSMVTITLDVGRNTIVAVFDSRAFLLNSKLL
jgi:hypothetical protein